MRMLTIGIEGVLFHQRRQTESHILGKTPPVRQSSRQSSAPTANPDGGLAMSREISLTQGKVAIVDDVNYEWLNQWKWTYRPDRYTGYAVRNLPRNKGKRVQVRMHRFILNTPPGMETDHRNMNGLDNRRVNLRICTKGQNQMNTRKRTGHTSRFKGVSWKTQDEKWEAKITVSGKRHHLGRYISEIDAAQAYDRAAREHYGAFARPNFAEKER